MGEVSNVGPVTDPAMDAHVSGCNRSISLPRRDCKAGAGVSLRVVEAISWASSAYILNLFTSASGDAAAVPAAAAGRISVQISCHSSRNAFSSPTFF